MRLSAKRDKPAEPARSASLMDRLLLRLGVCAKSMIERRYSSFRIFISRIKSVASCAVSRELLAK